MILRLDTSAAPFHPESDSVPDIKRAAKLLTSMRAELMRADFELVGTHDSIEVYENPKRHPAVVVDGPNDTHIIKEVEVDFQEHLSKHGLDGFAKWLKGRPKTITKEISE